MEKITVEVVVKGNLEKVWKYWNEPEYITQWVFASNDWECPHATNDLRVGGTFVTTMAAKDKSASFDFSGVYTDVHESSRIKYVMSKDVKDPQARTCEVTFEDVGNGEVKVSEIFDAETVNSIEMQKAGWQSILNNFKQLVENN